MRKRSYTVTSVVESPFARFVVFATAAAVCDGSLRSRHATFSAPGATVADCGQLGGLATFHHVHNTSCEVAASIAWSRQSAGYPGGVLSLLFDGGFVGGGGVGVTRRPGSVGRAGNAGGSVGSTGGVVVDGLWSADSWVVASG